MSGAVTEAGHPSANTASPVASDAWQSVARLLEHGTDAFLAVDGAWHVLYLNQLAESILGQPRAALLGQRLWDMFPDAVATASYGHMTRAMDERTRAEFDEYLAFLGRWLEVRVFPSDDGCWCFFRDISERKRAEQRQRFLAETSAALTASLAVDAVMATLTRHVTGALADWCMLDCVRDGALERMSVAHSDPTHEHLLHALTPFVNKHDGPHSPYRIVLETGESLLFAVVRHEDIAYTAYNDEHLRLLLALEPRSAMVVPLHVRGRVSSLLTFGRSRAEGAYTADDLVLAEELAGRAALALENAELYESERQARAAATVAAERATFLTEATGALAALLDYDATIDRLARLAVPRLADLCTIHMLTDDGKMRQLAVAHSDPAIEALVWDLERRYPIDAESMVGLALVVHSGAPEIVREVDDVRLHSFTDDAEHLGRLERLRMTSSLCLPLAVRGRTLGAISFIMAESQRRYPADDMQLAEELARRAALAVDNARLYRDAQDALHVRDQFLTVVSHELRTPLTALSGATQLFTRRTQRENSLNERDGRTLQLILAQAERLNKLVASLLDLSRMQLGLFSLELALLDVNALVRRVVEEYQLLLEQHTIAVEGDEGELVVRGDALRLDQVFQNLIQNAIKYSSEGSAISVCIGAEQGHARVAVRDTGIGIPDHALPQLFQRFYRAPNVAQHGGLGIGLYVVHEVVTRHGGAIRVASREGQGSTFTVELPLLKVEG